MTIDHPKHMTMLIAACFLLSSCSRPIQTPGSSTDLPSPTASATPSPQPSNTLIPPTGTPPPSHTLLPVDAAFQIVQNSSFDSGLSHWDQRMGRFSHAASQYYTSPGSGLIITSDSNLAGVAGQCVAIQERLADWPMTDGQRRITFEASLMTDNDIYQVSVVILFHQGDCSQPDQFHAQVGAMESAPVPGGQDWTQVMASGTIPGNAISVDILIWAMGRSETAGVYFDDVRSYPSEAQ